MSSDQRHSKDDPLDGAAGLIAAVVGPVGIVVGVVLGGVIGVDHAAGRAGNVFPVSGVLSHVIGAIVGGFAGVIPAVLVASFIDIASNVASFVRRHSAGEWVVRGASRVLPSVARQEAVEEWAAWLRDLRADGMPWHRRLVEVLSIVLVAAPRLAVTLWLSRRRAVDR